MKKHLIRLINIYIFLIITAGNAFAQSGKITIDYYGVVSSDIDSNMSKMTSDLYYTQLCEMDNFTVNDKREQPFLLTPPAKEKLNSNNLSFYTVINKNEKSDLWITNITLVDAKNNSMKTQQKEYSSYYQIMMEPKAVLLDSIKDLIKKEATVAFSEATPIPVPAQPASSQQQNKGTAISTEFLSGEWSGESSTSKIVIMRGGRAFITFSNGATMTAEISGSKSGDTTYITVAGKGRPNGSFFPELNREKALKAAVKADPIKWDFILKDNNTLEGNKLSLIEKDNQIIPGTIEATWKRK